ncbi:unnamed protein product [Bursaphelenchus okinawaensis]|uniref:Protein CASC3 n=1 Tax=Bursaphelenchus okinawaensis TaxID=465554 RepID=A0A811JTE1_9BILA|nr:unnamed protein product [Bursaphelenchus okinawaensis]CAG9082277.1 unnamed protein product [Bursaphelenchus okinawaensis]
MEDVQSNENIEQEKQKHFVQNEEAEVKKETEEDVAIKEEPPVDPKQEVKVEEEQIENPSNNDKTVAKDDEYEAKVSEDEQTEEENKSEEEKKEEAAELDDDEIKTNPAYIPKGGQFYMHDTRSGEAEEQNDANNKKSRADGKWSHDLYNEKRQMPKSSRELETLYGSTGKRECDGDVHSTRTSDKRERPVNQNNKPRNVIGNSKFSDRKPIRNRRQEKSSDEEPPTENRQRKFRTFKRSTNTKPQNENTPRDVEEVKKDFSKMSVSRQPQQKQENGNSNGGYRRSYAQPGPRVNLPAETMRIPPPVLPPPPGAMVVIPMGQQPVVPVMPRVPQHPPYNGRPRQPTDAVYFDPKAHVQGPPPQPRERRRLQFVPPQ